MQVTSQNPNVPQRKDVHRWLLSRQNNRGWKEGGFSRMKAGSLYPHTSPWILQHGIEDNQNASSCQVHDRILCILEAQDSTTFQPLAGRDEWMSSGLDSRCLWSASTLVSISLKALALWEREKRHSSLLQIPAAFIYAQVRGRCPPFFCLFPGVEAWNVSEGWKQNCFSSTTLLLGLLFRPKSQQFLSQCKLKSSQLETLLSAVGCWGPCLQHSSVFFVSPQVLLLWGRSPRPP